MKPVSFEYEYAPNVGARSFYIHQKDEPWELKQYLCLGPSLYTKIQQSLTNSVKCYHDYHQCQTCNQCHVCKICNCCLDNPFWCSNCITNYMTSSDDTNFDYFWNENFKDQWIHWNVIYLRQQKFNVLGLNQYYNIWTSNEINQIENVGNLINDRKYIDKTQENSFTRQKNFEGAGYEWLQEHKTNDKRFNFGYGITIQVHPIEPQVIRLIVNKLESLQLLPLNSINAIAYNNYVASKKMPTQASEGTKVHLDERTKFDDNTSIHILRLLSGIFMRFGAGHFNKSPMFMIPFDKNTLLEMKPWFAGCDWIKHSIDPKETGGHTACFIVRRVRPFLLPMCQYKHNPK